MIISFICCSSVFSPPHIILKSEMTAGKCIEKAAWVIFQLMRCYYWLVCVMGQQRCLLIAPLTTEMFGRSAAAVCQGPLCLLLSCCQTSRALNPPLSSCLCFRDFAYVARDKNTRVLKCHVFRCDTPAAAIATSLHEICSKVGVIIAAASAWMS